METILSHNFYARNTVAVAQDLLGKVIIREIDGKRMAGIIVETEAYQSDDPACHAFSGKTNRTAPLFGPVGHTYVYLIYGMYHCLNIVARDSKMAAGGVLIRALEPLDGRGHMASPRTNGPGKLTQALSITRADIGLDVTKPGSLFIIDRGNTVSFSAICATSRIGITRGTEKLWRFFIKDNPWVSKP